MQNKIERQSALELAKRAAMLAAEKQALDIIILDLRKVTDFADYFVICSGVVDVHVRAVFDHIETELRKEGNKPSQVEGSETMRWILMDYIDVIVNIFQPDARGYYSLERLWGDAEQVEIEEIAK